jgi:hypothetical protein
MTWSRTTIAIVVSGLVCSGSEAGILCRDGYQVVAGREISTPYCNDNYVASIARKHGVKVTDAEVRNNPARKSEVCRFVGNDIEIQHYCDDPDSKRGR